MNRILALVDRSVYAASVVDHAAWVAGLTGASIDVVHVLDPIDPAAVNAGMAGLAVGGPGIVRGSANYSEAKLQQLTYEAQQLVDRLTTRTRDSGAGVVVGRVIVGELRQFAEESQRDFDLIVVGKRGETADFVGLRLGSQLRNVVHVAGKLVLIVPRAYRPLASWLLAVGKDNEISRGLDDLIQSRMLETLPGEIVHVGELTVLIRTDLEGIGMRLTHAGVRARIAVLDGEPVRAVAERLATAESQLVVVGKFGRSRVLPMIFGDGVARDLTKVNQGPVLVLPEASADGADAQAQPAAAAVLAGRNH
jgi:nucleotide-binding universal stress UspA family protein